MRILLIGIGGTYNYGCEAIVRGTERILRHAMPGVEIVYYSPVPTEDSRRLAGCGVEVQPRDRQGLDRMARRLANKPFRLLRRRPPLDLERAVSDFDLALSIGGDIYTQYSGHLPWAIMAMGERIMRQGVPYAVWGASIGPFRGSDEEIRPLMTHFRRCRFIAVRENRTLEYLKSQGVKHNLFSMLDPAFALAEIPPVGKEGTVRREGGRIGINLSPLSAKEMGIDRRQMVRQQGAMIGHLAASSGADILLLPHVVSTAHLEDDDLGYLRQVLAAVPVSVRDQVQLVEDDPGFLGLKPALRSCDVVIAARMHCGINALSEGIPVLFLAYSDKARGMAERMYGHGRYVADVRDSGSEAFADSVLEVLPRLRAESLAVRAAEWKQEALCALDSLAGVGPSEDEAGPGAGP